MGLCMGDLHCRSGNFCAGKFSCWEIFELTFSHVSFLPAGKAYDVQGSFVVGRGFFVDVFVVRRCLCTMTCIVDQEISMP